MVGMRDGNDHNDPNNGDDYCGGFDVDGVDEVVDDDDDSSALMPKTDTGCTLQCCKAILGFCYATWNMDVSHF